MRYDSVFTQTGYKDTSLSKDTTYYYALQTFDNTFSNPYSPLSVIQSARPNDPPKVDTVLIINIS